MNHISGLGTSALSPDSFPMIEVGRENREVPKWLATRIAEAGGWNPYGEQNFRVVWGWSRLAIVGGKWEDRDEYGNLVREVCEYRWVPKYPDLDCWHLEKKMPPEFYGSPTSWEALTREVDGPYTYLALGPFPSRGEYEHVTSIRNPDGTPVGELTPTICEYIIRAVEWSRHLVASDRRKGIEMREEQKARQEDCFADDVLADAEPAFLGRPHIVVPSLSETLNLSKQRSGF